MPFYFIFNKTQFLTKHNIQLTTYIYLNRKLFIFIFRFYATRYACHLTHSCCSLLQCCNYRLYLIEWNFIKIFSHRKKMIWSKKHFSKGYIHKYTSTTHRLNQVVGLIQWTNTFESSNTVWYNSQTSKTITI